MKKFTKKELEIITKLVEEAYIKAGREIKYGILIKDIDKEGKIKGDIVIDKRDKKDIN